MMKQHAKIQEPLIRQYIFEADAWKRLLVFFMQENVSFKIRLAEILNQNAENGLLTSAEKFNEDFLAQDRTIAFLTEELQKQILLLENNPAGMNGGFKEIVQAQEKLRREVKIAERIFFRIKEEFSEFLTVNY